MNAIEIMTNEQMYVLLKMIRKIVEKSEDKKEILESLDELIEKETSKEGQ